MPVLSELRTRDLTWQFPQSLNGRFELEAAGVVVGWLRFDDPFGARAVAEIEGKTWEFDYNCSPHPSVSVFPKGSRSPIAEYCPRLIGGGIVTFASGACYCWSHARVWSSQWCFRREGEAAICMSQQSGALREGGKVRLCERAAEFPETAILVLLAWYLRVLAFESLTKSVPAVG